VKRYQTCATFVTSIIHENDWTHIGVVNFKLTGTRFILKILLEYSVLTIWQWRNTSVGE
jgi:hypothetical protein